MSKMRRKKGTGVIIQNDSEWLAVVPTRQINLYYQFTAGNINIIYHGIRTENKMNGTCPISSTSNYMVSIASAVSLIPFALDKIPISLCNEHAVLRMSIDINEH